MTRVDAQHIEEACARIIRGAGQRFTDQRLAVIRGLITDPTKARNGYELHAILHERGFCVLTVVAIYRIFKNFRELGIVRRIGTLDGSYVLSRIDNGRTTVSCCLLVDPENGTAQEVRIPSDLSQALRRVAEENNVKIASAHIELRLVSDDTEATKEGSDA